MTRDEQVAPRFSLAWQPLERSVLRLSAGRYAQSQRIHELEVEDGITTFAPAETSDQLSLAFESRSTKGWRFRAGVFARELEDLRPRFENLWNPLELFPEVQRDRLRIDASRARARGLELSLISPRSAKRISGRVAATLSRSEDREGGRWVPRSWDQRFAASASITFALSERSSLSLAAVGRSGWPTTPPEALDTGELSTLRNSDRLGGYLRLDARYSFTRRTRAGTFRLDLAVTNLTDRTNDCCVDVEFDPDSGELSAETESWTGIAPYVSLSWQPAPG